ncbi:MAG: hypothetical protein K8S00_04325 [Bacteroidales bacterium]|nr:hypothetical protein [Bacteroidales bacterium]
MTKKGNPKVGHFAYGANVQCNTVWSQDVDLNLIGGWVEGSTIYIAAHATVVNGIQTESAWGNGTPFPGNNWSMYFECTPPSWTCGDPIVDERDGQSYNTVLIGDQCWMAENLAYLPQVDHKEDGSEDSPGNYYYVYEYAPYGANESEEIANAKNTFNYNTYGVLYNWPAAMAGANSSSSIPSGIQGACPDGWHLPSDAEWTVLTDNLGGASVAGGEMKETGTTHWIAPNTGATNNSGFTALPAGIRSGHPLEVGRFKLRTRNTYIWSSTDESSSYPYALYRLMVYNYAKVYGFPLYQSYGFSVRCVKD